MFQAVADTHIATAADRLGHLIRAEDGVREAVRQLEIIAAQHPARDWQPIPRHPMAKERSLMATTVLVVMWTSHGLLASVAFPRG